MGPLRRATRSLEDLESFSDHPLILSCCWGAGRGYLEPCPTNSSRYPRTSVPANFPSSNCLSLHFDQFWLSECLFSTCLALTISFYVFFSFERSQQSAILIFGGGAPRIHNVITVLIWPSEKTAVKERLHNFSENEIRHFLCCTPENLCSKKENVVRSKPENLC